MATRETAISLVFHVAFVYLLVVAWRVVASGVRG